MNNLDIAINDQNLTKLRNKTLATDNHKIVQDPQDKHLSMDSLDLHMVNLDPI